ncbi:hypothetical protein Aspvir_009595 [Aspergillus viridinutans]|uniref:Peptidase S33 tripeptidyl aminopeptidase-like C-terminal domain-containing protein n=1 Tax=Aspergillus viridinutans TaxID=75553 RepID=A0A9P3BZS6_ASPVI|nr:uncharacterized protein Aspvir_009595 [Aspergillus viridinutans]GIK05483.1 hypothetical protein Aspvir_009595 [Aspergillus viridinutans]
MSRLTDSITRLGPAIQRTSSDPRPVVLMTCAVAGSGKTTLAKSVCSTYPSFTRLSIDTYVYSHHGLYNVDYPKELYEKYLNEAEEALKQQLVHILEHGNSNVVLDFSFAFREVRDVWKALISDAGGRWVLVYLDADPTEIRRRVAARNALIEKDGDSAFYLTEDVLERYLSGFERPVGEGEIVINKTENELVPWKRIEGGKHSLPAHWSTSTSPTSPYSRRSPTESISPASSGAYPSATAQSVVCIVASFVGTPAVAHDLFTYINAEQKLAGKPVNESKISYLAVSYGTVLGATFASLYPDHVGRMVLDGVVDAADYYDLGWRTNLYDADKALDSFSEYCFQGGPTNCSYWGPSVQNITGRLNGLLAKLKYHPVPIPSSDACDIPLLATYSDLKEYILIATYAPLSNFPVLADVLSGLERGSTSAYVRAATDGFLPANPCNNGSGKNGTTDVNTLIKCVDGYAGHKFENLTDYRNYVDTLTLQSRFFGEVWPNNANGISCRSFDAKPPKSGRLPGSILETRQTSFPILCVTTETDPVAPKRGAYKMSSVFPGSVVLTQASVGHTAIASISSCYLKNVQMYLNGQLPAANTTCPPDVLPFQGSASFSFGL